MNISYKIDDKDAKKALERSPTAVITAINYALRRSAVFTQRCFRKNMPAGATGNLRRSVSYKFLTKVSVKIEPELEYADYVEYGTKPHWTSVRNLERWANLKGINPYALQHSIAKHGTKPHPYLHKTATEAEAFARKELQTDVAKAVERTI